MRQASPLHALGLIFACKYLGIFCGFGSVDVKAAAGLGESVGADLAEAAVLVCITLLARGRDVGFICEELCISRNTANAHRKAIFSKLGIHSQQELLDAVEQGRGGE